MSQPSLPEKVLQIDGELERERLGHAFGGALALAYYAEPRVTVDIDVNVFIPPARFAEAEAVLLELGVDGPADPVQLQRDGWYRYMWGVNPVDVFYQELDLHFAIERACRRVPFGPGEIPILAPEHLMTCKALLDRPKDWLDIEQMLIGAPETDVDEVKDWLREFLPEDDPRHTRLAELAS